MCDILGFGLEHGVQSVYDIFLERRCLDVFRGHSLRPSLVGVINGYVAGLAAPHASIDTQRHLDYLHEPENLFLACCVLTPHGWEDPSELPSDIAETGPAGLSGKICRDIRALANLLQDDGEEFFVQQQKWTLDGFKDLKPEVINQAKSNIHFSLDELDGFFSDSRNMNIHSSMYPPGSMARRFLGDIYQYLPYPRRREKDEVQV
ncbi:hypothetical protein IW261DRAFT_1425697 [Armillaria novae-zelandiae]|uniref:Uncharacterized protein n=1 Tax=Armillaria novae-zelandiae TaxID=153914 RepID=A0AA39TZH3_9AGAR|nr:hypothetical protein IW261DRAFT_1425697 [Armillaria novae-zelandiae]